MTCCACKTEFCWICRQNYKKHDLAICKGHITTDSSYLDKLRDRRRFQSLKTRMEMYRLVSYYSTLLVSKYDDVQDTRAKNAFNARVIRFFSKCYQLIINNQVDTQRLILTFTQ